MSCPFSPYPVDDGLPPPRSVLGALVPALLAAEAVRHRVERAVAARCHLPRPVGHSSDRLNQPKVKVVPYTGHVGHSNVAGHESGVHTKRHGTQRPRYGATLTEIGLKTSGCKLL